jgi:hypothetical protein
MRVYLRRRNVGMAKDRLYGAEVRAILDHVRGAGMPKHVRGRVPSRSRRRLPYHLPDALPGQLAATICDKQKR